MQQVNDSGHQPLITKVLTNNVFPDLKKPMFTELTLTKLESFMNTVYKVTTDQGTFVAKIPKPSEEGQGSLNPPHIVLITEEIIRDNNYGPKEYFKDHSCLILEYIENTKISQAEGLLQDTKLLFLFPLTEFSKMKISEQQRANLNTDKSMIRLFLDHSVRNSLLEVKDKLVKGELDDLNVTHDKVPQLLEYIEEMENPESKFNTLLTKFESRKEDMILGHNDFHTGNLIKCAKNAEKFYLVDYEFSCMNILGWDLTNIICMDLIPHHVEKEEDMFIYSPQSLPSPENLREILKAYLLLLSDAKIEETGMDFIAKLRDGSYNDYVNQEKLDRLYNEFFQILYLNNVWFILWCVMKCLVPEMGDSLNLPLETCRKIHEMAKAKF